MGKISTIVDTFFTCCTSFFCIWITWVPTPTIIGDNTLYIRKQIVTIFMPYTCIIISLNITFTNMADTVAKKGRDFWKLSDIYQWPLQVWSSNSCLLINFQFRVFACVIWFNLGSTNLIIGNKIISRTLWHVNWFNVEISIKTSSFFSEN